MISRVSSLCQIISGGCLCRDKYFKGISIFVSVLFNLYRDAMPLWSIGKTLARMQEILGSNSTESKFVFQFYSIEWNVKNCFEQLILNYQNEIVKRRLCAVDDQRIRRAESNLQRVLVMQDRAADLTFICRMQSTAVAEKCSVCPYEVSNTCRGS